METAKHKILFLPNWQYLTTGEMDAASLPALLFYFVTKNIYLSYGLAGVFKYNHLGVFEEYVFKKAIQNCPG